MWLLSYRCLCQENPSDTKYTPPALLESYKSQNMSVYLMKILGSCSVPRYWWANVPMNNSCCFCVKNIWRKIPKPLTDASSRSHLSELFVFAVKEKMKWNNDPYPGFRRGFIRKEQITNIRYMKMIQKIGFQGRDRMMLKGAYELNWF